MNKPSVEIWFELETRCNLACKFCFNYWKDGSVKAPERLSTVSTLEALRRLLSAVECEKLTISGGEPLLRNDLTILLEYIGSFGVPMVLTTNGTLLNLSVISKLTALGIVTFQIPLHSTDASRHNYLSGGECWDHSVAALIELQSLGLHSVPVFVATKTNLSDLPEVVELCGALGLRELIFNRFVPTGLGKVYLDKIGVPSEGELIDELLACESIARRTKVTIHLGMPIDVPSWARLAMSYVTFASCPISENQRRFTVDAAANIRRCNQSAGSIVNILKSDEEELAKELGRKVSMPEADYRPCQILEREKLVQIGSPLAREALRSPEYKCRG